MDKVKVESFHLTGRSKKNIIESTSSEQRCWVRILRHPPTILYQFICSIKPVTPNSER